MSERKDWECASNEAIHLRLVHSVRELQQSQRIAELQHAAAAHAEAAIDRAKKKSSSSDDDTALITAQAAAQAVTAQPSQLGRYAGIGSGSAGSNLFGDEDSDHWLFHPKFSHQLFKGERILGFHGIVINIWFASATLMAYVDISYAKAHSQMSQDSLTDDVPAHLAIMQDDDSGSEDDDHDGKKNNKKKKKKGSGSKSSKGDKEGNGKVSSSSGTAGSQHPMGDITDFEDEVHEVAERVVSKIRRDGWLTDFDAFKRELQQDNRKWRPPGRCLREYTYTLESDFRRNPCSSDSDSGGGGGGKNHSKKSSSKKVVDEHDYANHPDWELESTVYEIRHGSFADERIKRFHDSIQFFLLFYIDGSSYINGCDLVWELLFIWEKHTYRRRGTKAKGKSGKGSTTASSSKGNKKNQQSRKTTTATAAGGKGKGRGGGQKRKTPASSKSDKKKSKTGASASPRGRARNDSDDDDDDDDSDDSDDHSDDDSDGDDSDDDDDDDDSDNDDSDDDADVRRQYNIVGYTTLYKFLKYPVGWRLRISQILVLPPYQHCGHGHKLLQIVYDECARRRMIEVNIEDPSEGFQAVRLLTDLQNCWLHSKLNYEHLYYSNVQHGDVHLNCIANEQLLHQQHSVRSNGDGSSSSSSATSDAIATANSSGVAHPSQLAVSAITAGSGFALRMASPSAGQRKPELTLSSRGAPTTPVRGGGQGGDAGGDDTTQASSSRSTAGAKGSDTPLPPPSPNAIVQQTSSLPGLSDTVCTEVARELHITERQVRQCYHVLLLSTIDCVGNPEQYRQYRLMIKKQLHAHHQEELSIFGRNSSDKKEKLHQLYLMQESRYMALHSKFLKNIAALSPKTLAMRTAAVKRQRQWARAVASGTYVAPSTTLSSLEGGVGSSNSPRARRRVLATSTPVVGGGCGGGSKQAKSAASSSLALPKARKSLTVQAGPASPRMLAAAAAASSSSSSNSDDTDRLTAVMPQSWV